MPEHAPGPLMIIGGAEDKRRKRAILATFVAASGGLDARIEAIPTELVARLRGATGIFMIGATS